MKRGSLRLRLLLAAALAISLALLAAGIGLRYLFEQHVERRATRELDNIAKQVIALMRVTPKGKLMLTGQLSEPRFSIPYSGIYWQVSGPDGPLLRSRSLWDFVLKMPDGDLGSGGLYEVDSNGPLGTSLLTVIRPVTMTIGGKKRHLSIAVALDHAEISASVQDFTQELIIALGGLALLLFAATWVQVGVGLAPLNRLAREIAAIRDGRSARISPGHPSEVMPLVDEINALLAQQEQAMETARTRAGSLAHGLKTPLSVLSAARRRLKDTPRPEDLDSIGQEIDEQIQHMRRHIDRELARARIRGSTAGIRRTTVLKPLVERLIAMMQKLPRGDRLDWRVDIGDDIVLAADTDDMAEILGNLLDNARKWAASVIAVTARPAPGGIVIAIEDDGPGVAEEDFANIIRRGDRRDETVHGTGLGLSIAHDVVSAYEQELTFARSAFGGFAVSFTLPAAGYDGIGTSD